MTSSRPTCRTKLRQSDFINTTSKLINDYIQYGNCFATVDYTRKFTEFEDGDRVPPTTLVQNLFVSLRLIFALTLLPLSLLNTPKIVRSVLTLGEVQRMVEETIDNEYMSDIFSKMLGNRGAAKGNEVDVHKSEGFVADGFSNYYRLL